MKTTIVATALLTILLSSLNALAMEEGKLVSSAETIVQGWEELQKPIYTIKCYVSRFMSLSVPRNLTFCLALIDLWLPPSSPFFVAYSATYGGVGGVLC
jgi:hypothetical protein